MNNNGYSTNKSFDDMKLVLKKIRSRADELEAVLDNAPTLTVLIVSGHGMLAALTAVDVALEKVVTRAVRVINTCNKLGQ